MSALAIGQPLVFGDALERRREIEAHDGRAVLAGQAQERIEHGLRRRAVFRDELYRPRTDVLVGVVEDLDQRVGRPQPRDVQRPHRAQPPVRAGALDEQLAQLLADGRVQLAGRGARLEDDAGAAGMPVAGARLQLHELGVGQRLQIAVAAVPVFRQRLRRRDAEDAPGLLVQ